MTPYEQVLALLPQRAAHDRTRFWPGDAVVFFDLRRGPRKGEVRTHYYAQGADPDEVVVTFPEGAYPEVAVRAAFLAHDHECGCEGCAAVRRVRQ